MAETPEPLNQSSLERGARELASKDADLAGIVERLGEVVPAAVLEVPGLGPWRAVAARLLWAHYLDARGQLNNS